MVIVLDTVSVDLPRELIRILKIREKDFSRAVLESIAVELYREGLISLGKAAEIARVSKWEMYEVLTAKKVPIQYYPEDLKQDIKTLKKALG
jgi:predicted HTH domain antitoxin